MLVYRRVDNLELLGYSYSNYARSSDDLKSTSKYIFMLVGGAVSWKSVKQTLTTSSTMQAEFISYYRTATQAVWLKNFMIGLQFLYPNTKPLTIYCDNMATVFFTRNNKSFNRSKHFELKYLTVRDLVKKGDITIEHIDTESMLAHPLTKSLKLICFANHVENMGVLSSFDVLG